MTSPVFFTENQAGVNPHDQLSDLESAQIIISHVSEGLKMAEKVGLPGIIKDLSLLITERASPSISILITVMLTLQR